MNNRTLQFIRRWNNKVHRDSAEADIFAWYQEGLNPDVQRYIPLLKKNKVSNILDVGCGDGGNLIPLCRNGFYVTGIDLSSAGLKSCTAKAKKLQLTNFQLVEANMQNMPFRDNSFDFVISNFAIGEMLLFPGTGIKDAELVIKEIYRVLKSKSYAFIQLTTHVVKEYKTKNVTDWSITEDKYEQILKKCKFKIIEKEQNSFRDPPHLGATKGYNKLHTHYWNSYLIFKT